MSVADRHFRLMCFEVSAGHRESGQPRATRPCPYDVRSKIDPFVGSMRTEPLVDEFSFFLLFIVFHFSFPFARSTD